MAQLPVFSAGQEFLLSLEKERFNVAHRVTAEPVVVFKEVPVKCKKKHQSDQRDKFMFHAGRFAAGARDASAVAANEWLEKHL